MTKINRTYGWRPDLPDQRDFAFTWARLGKIPAYVDLRSGLPPVYDQLALGDCTGNAISGAIEFDRFKQGMPRLTPSRLFIYYNERLIEGTTTSDAGASLRDGMKTIDRQGVCPESYWPYNPLRFAIMPTRDAYMAASRHKSITYWSVAQDLGVMLGCLANRYPFVAGFSVYESFESQETARTGQVVMPSASEPMLGGHAVLVVGYNEERRCFLCRNSWGLDWGMDGYFWMPYAYLLSPDLAGDFWTLRQTA